LRSTAEGDLASIGEPLVRLLRERRDEINRFLAGDPVEGLRMTGWRE